MSEDVLESLLESPFYLALIECAPPVKAEVLSEAVSPLTLAVPNEVAPSKNSTVPVTPEGVIDAFNFTSCPYVDGLLLEETVVVELTRLTV